MTAKGSLGTEEAAAAAAICACFNIRRTARAITRLFDDALQPAGLRSTQFVLLISIAAAPDAGLPTLAANMGLDRSALTRRLKSLQAAGWVRVESSRAAGPSRASLTAKGRRKLEQAAPHWQRAQSRFVGTLGDDRWSGLLDDLGAARDAAGER